MKIKTKLIIRTTSTTLTVVERIKQFTKVYPYSPGGVGTPIAAFLAGKAKLDPIGSPPATVFHEGSGKVMNTLPPNDWTYYEMLNEVVLVN